MVTLECLLTAIKALKLTWIRSFIHEDSTWSKLFTESTGWNITMVLHFG